MPNLLDVILVGSLDSGAVDRGEPRESLEERNRRLELVLGLSGAWVYIVSVGADGTLRREWAAGEIDRITGYTQSELDRMGSGLAIVHPDDRASLDGRLHRLLAGEADTREYRIVAKSGEVRWLNDSARPEWDAAKERVVRICGAAHDVTERRQGEAQLAAALRERENLLETIPDVIYILDCEGRLSGWNKPLETATGRSHEQIKGHSALEFFSEVDRPRVAEAIGLAFVSGYAELDAELINLDGSGRPYHFSGVPLKDERGEVIGLTGVGRDISERKRAEALSAALLAVAHDLSGTLEMTELLERVERRAADTLPADMVATFYWDTASGGFRAVSQHGVPLELVPALNAISFSDETPFGGRVAAGHSVAIDDLRQIPALAAFPNGALLTSPLRVHDRHLGTLVAFRTGVGQSFTPTDVALCEGIARQLSLAMATVELYRAQQEQAEISGALARVGSELMSAFGTPDLLERLCRVTVEVLGCDTSHTSLYLPAEDAYAVVSGHGYSLETWEAMRLLKVPRAWFEQGGRSIIDDVRQTSARRLPERLGQLTQQVNISTAIGIPLRRGDELIGYHSACFLSQEKEFTHIQEQIAQGIGQLASMALEQARTLEALERASRLKSEFVATMSHELRTPLNVILGYNELLRDGVLGSVSEKQAHALARSDSAARDLLELIEETLDLSRLDGGRAALELRDSSLSDLLGEIAAESRFVASKQAVRFVCDVPLDLPRLYTDPLKLKVVLKNLLGNAFKFTDEGFVRVGARAAGDRLEIVVEDSGIGIAPEACEYIFEAFRQGDSSTTRRHDGVGLGLYIVRRLVDLLRGSISVESEVGHGSVFRIDLPQRCTADTLAA